MKTKTLLKHAVLLLSQCLVFTMFLSIQLSAQIDKQLPRQRQTANSSTLQGSNQFANSKFTYKIIDAPNKTFGYDIYADDRMMIHQPSIPGVPGNEGFKSKADAVKVGQLVIGKIKKGEMPPTVTIEEMKKLKVV